MYGKLPIAGCKHGGYQVGDEMRKLRLIEEAESGCVVGDGSEQIKALCERAREEAEWYAVRWKALHEHLKACADKKLFEECCSIMANGTADSFDPPTYDLILNRLKATIAQAAALADTGSHAHKSRFDPDDIGEIPTGWRVVEAIRDRLVNGS